MSWYGPLIAYTVLDLCCRNWVKTVADSQFGRLTSPSRWCLSQGRKEGLLPCTSLYTLCLCPPRGRVALAAGKRIPRIPQSSVLLPSPNCLQPPRLPPSLGPFRCPNGGFHGSPNGPPIDPPQSMICLPRIDRSSGQSASSFVRRPRGGFVTPHDFHPCLPSPTASQPRSCPAQLMFPALPSFLLKPLASAAHLMERHAVEFETADIALTA